MGKNLKFEEEWLTDEEAYQEYWQNHFLLDADRKNGRYSDEDREGYRDEYQRRAKSRKTPRASGDPNHRGQRQQYQ